MGIWWAVTGLIFLAATGFNFNHSTVQKSTSAMAQVMCVPWDDLLSAEMTRSDFHSAENGMTDVGLFGPCAGEPNVLYTYNLSKSEQMRNHFHQAASLQHCKHFKNTSVHLLLCITAPSCSFQLARICLL